MFSVIINHNHILNFLTPRSDIYASIEFRLPTTNGSSGAFLAARADEGGCTSFLAHGVFFFAFPDRFVLANDLSKKGYYTFYFLSIYCIVHLKRKGIKWGKFLFTFTFCPSFWSKWTPKSENDGESTQSFPYSISLKTKG